MLCMDNKKIVASGHPFITTKNVNMVVELVKTLLVAAISLILVSVIVLIASKEPGKAMYSFFVGPFTTRRRFSQIIECAIPLMFTAQALIVMFRANQINFAAEGAFFLGALGAALVGIYVPLPPVIHVIACLLAATAFGMVVTVVPGFIKAKWGASELVASLMMNYLVSNFVVYVINYHIRDIESGFVASKEFLPTAKLPKLFQIGNIHAGLIISLGVTLLVMVFLFRTRMGYNLRMTGENRRFARFSGINIFSVTLYSQIIGGVLAGLGGGVELLGYYTRFRWAASPGYGFIGLVVAMLARKNPAFVPLAAIFYGYMQVGAEIMGRDSDLSPEVVWLIQAVIVVLIAAQAFMAGWRQKMVVKAAANDKIMEEGGAL
jgi:simple sugar transport system permease protein